MYLGWNKCLIVNVCLFCTFMHFTPSHCLANFVLHSEICGDTTFLLMNGSLWKLMIKCHQNLLHIQVPVNFLCNMVLTRDRPIYRYRPKRPIFSASVGVDKTLLYSSHILTNLHKKAQRTKSRQLSCSNASKCIFINKQTRWTTEHVSTVATETKASSLITLIKHHTKFWNCCN